MEERKRIIFDISSGTIIRIILIVLAVALLFFLRDVLLVILASLIIAAAVDSFADWLQRFKVPRVLSVVIVYIIFLAFLAGLVALVVPPVVDQAREMSANFPEFKDSLFSKYEGVKGFSERYGLVEKLEEAVSGVGAVSTTGGILSRTAGLFGGIASMIFILVISFYLAVAENGIKKFITAVVPEEHHAYVLRLIEKMKIMVGRWVRGQLLVAAIMGVVIGVVLWLAGVKFALVLGVLGGVLEFIPVIGPIIAGLLGTAMALTISPWLGLGIFIFYIVLNQLENHVLIPNIMRKAVGLNPIVVILALLIGYKVAGVVGILLSIPVATIVAVFIRDLMGDKNSALEEYEDKVAKKE